MAPSIFAYVDRDLISIQPIKSCIRNEANFNFWGGGDITQCHLRADITCLLSQ